MSWGLGGGAGLSVLKLVLGVYLLLTGLKGWAQSTSEVHGHVFHEEGYAPCSDALIQAWPCGHSFPVSPEGRFDVNCPEGVDSLTVLAHGHRVVTVAVEGRTHIDVELASLAVSLEQAEVDGRTSEDLAEARDIVDSGPLLETLDRVPGVRGLDLGAGMIQPVLRGLVGSRVAVLEDGVPQAGGRWGADHGVLLDPALYDGMQWVPGGGHVWLGPDAMGGGLRMQALRMLGAEGNRLQFGSAQRMGDGRTKVHALYRQRQGEFQWHFGLSVQRFGDRNVPQSTFRYLGRQFDLPEGRLPNTGGRGLHGIAGFRWSDPVKGRFGLDFRWSEVLQGLFPGIVGIPDQSDLLGDGRPYAVELPHQKAGRIQVAGKWMRPGLLDRTLRFSVSGNQRREHAPTHAHGFGPEPESDLSLRLDELHCFAEGRWEGIHGAFGLQAEVLKGRTTGWEFLLPDHGRTRVSAIGDFKLGAGRLAVRLDGFHVVHAQHEEPLYAADGSIVGDDVRTLAMNRFMPGWVLGWNRPFRSGAASGSWAVTAYSRAPSNYALAANGIHHGTFRFEQGNPDLSPEKTLEFRGGMGGGETRSESGFQWNIRGFVALHQGFIHLTPTARFAPIVHAGQIYAFEARDAFRMGGEVELGCDVGKGRLSGSLALLGQWALETGLGLPFTSPSDARTAFHWPLGKRVQVGILNRTVAAARITARNEAPTPGARLWGFECAVHGKRSVLAFEIDNMMNEAWLDHVSAYRTLGLVSQGRWASLRFTHDVSSVKAAP